MPIIDHKFSDWISFPLKTRDQKTIFFKIYNTIINDSFVLSRDLNLLRIALKIIKFLINTILITKNFNHEDINLYLFIDTKRSLNHFFFENICVRYMQIVYITFFLISVNINLVQWKSIDTLCSAGPDILWALGEIIYESPF